MAELAAVLDGHHERIRDDLDLVTIGAYRQVGFSWKKRLPPISEFMAKRTDDGEGREGEWTPEELEALRAREVRRWDRYYAKHGIKPTVH